MCQKDFGFHVTSQNLKNYKHRFAHKAKDLQVALLISFQCSVYSINKYLPSPLSFHPEIRFRRKKTVPEQLSLVFSSFLSFSTHAPYNIPFLSLVMYVTGSTVYETRYRFFFCFMKSCLCKYFARNIQGINIFQFLFSSSSQFLTRKIENVKSSLNVRYERVLITKRLSLL